jgi:hypothetical protein
LKCVSLLPFTGSVLGQIQVTESASVAHSICLVSRLIHRRYGGRHGISEATPVNRWPVVLMPLLKPARSHKTGFGVPDPASPSSRQTAVGMPSAGYIVVSLEMGYAETPFT